ncbi:hypothetical protein DICSQDRAFT_155698 [Dichomitus squalens LYAD-421 SS1]|uniref:Uncharacterized protein n=1 Tax=Dichomitus squalens (strain LYAD-421) TaxID=732165 RepID=R7SWV2_DICSQ|nr:uncharacterized protein DICSQDRAFT_155698 [Dichomitus squalens LYAD-421 SS1]EJF60566.1 hypothetical protein DICSQDRAFT_155698 [Dichomitus squalens LYAD-421 SS1]
MGGLLDYDTRQRHVCWRRDRCGDASWLLQRESATGRRPLVQMPRSLFSGAISGTHAHPWRIGAQWTRFLEQQ